MRFISSTPIELSYRGSVLTPHTRPDRFSSSAITPHSPSEVVARSELSVSSRASSSFVLLFPILFMSRPRLRSRHQQFIVAWPTKYAKIVVTDDQGRYVIPDLPNANYQVWVRGYGLVDSPKVRAKPGQQLNLTAVAAPNERAAAPYYPAIYWYAMMKLPPANAFVRSTEIPKNITLYSSPQRIRHVDSIA